MHLLYIYYKVNDRLTVVFFNIYKSVRHVCVSAVLFVYFFF